MKERDEGSPRDDAVSAESFRIFFDNSPIGKCMTAPDGRLLRVNRAFGSMLGYAIEEMQRISFVAITHPDDVAESQEGIRALRAGDCDSWQMEKRYQRKDGAYLWTHVTTALQRDRHGQPLYFLTHIEDISERHRYEDKLSHLNAVLRAIRNVNQAIVEEKDLDRLIARIVASLVETRGYRSAWILVDGDGTPARFAGAGQADDDGIRQRIATGWRPPCAEPACPSGLFVRRDGSGPECQDCPLAATYQGCESLTVRLGDEPGRGALAVSVPESYARDSEELDLVRAVADDVAFALRVLEQEAERHQATETLRVSEAFNRTVVASIPQKLFLKDRKSNYLRVNQAYAADFGVAPSEFVGKDDFAFYPRELAEKYRADDHQVIVSGQVKEVEESYVVAGQTFWVSTVKAPVRDDRGEVVALLGLFTDISERKAYQSRLEAANAALELSNRELEQFAYVASHDLQEPLRMVSSYTQLLAQRYQDQLDQDARDFIEFAVDGANRMQALIQDLLAYSRVTTRGAPPTRVDPHEALGEAVRNLHMAIREAGALVTNDELPLVRVDRIQLVQLFQNLIGNAIKFREPSEPARVHISARAEDSGVVFSVTDNGIGIDPKYFDRLFVIFQRLHTRQDYPGTGIGLALCKRIVERHDGRIWLDSEPGRGTTIYFTLPAAQKPNGGNR